MSAPAADSPAFKTLEFSLKVQGARINVNSQLPDGPVRPAAVLPIIQNLSTSISTLTENESARIGRPVSCCEGCGACCRQAVPIAPVEARMLAEYIDALSEERREELHARFRAAVARLEGSGVAHELREAAALFAKDPSLFDKERTHSLGLRYFALGIPCPFLEDERCTIHPVRPLRCREYLVVSPAEHCAHPETEEVVTVKPSVLLSRTLGKWDASGEPQPPELIIMTMLDEWIAAHPSGEDRAARTVPELLHEFLAAFASEKTFESGTNTGATPSRARVPNAQ
jgi:Fe-S-cluster containining protein